MYHSITIGDKNTWDDWKMIPSSGRWWLLLWKRSSRWMSRERWHDLSIQQLNRLPCIQ